MESATSTPGEPPRDGTPLPVGVTERAARQIAKIIAGESAPKMLRVAVDGGGCSGFQYRYELVDTANEDDLVIERDGVKVLIDEMSLPFLEGSEIDYVDDLIGASFQIRNPNAVSACGCGTSFSV